MDKPFLHIALIRNHTYCSVDLLDDPLQQAFPTDASYRIYHTII